MPEYSESWFIRDPGRLRIERLDKGCLIFDRNSGDSHYLEEPAATAISMLAEKPHTTAQLTDAITECFYVDNPHELHEFLADLLQKLQQKALVES